MEPIFDKLYQFTYKIPGMPLDCHQYLLLCDPAILFSVGSADMARDFLPKVKELLAGRPLKYLFISHREWDECGGLAVLHKMFPETIVICSQNAAGNFKFNDYDGKVIACTPGQPFTDGGLELDFLPYPVEPHYNLGLLAYEKNSGVFSSADLFLKGGNTAGVVEECNWKDLVDAIPENFLNMGPQQPRTIAALRAINPKFVAVGHGPCFICK